MAALAAPQPNNPLGELPSLAPVARAAPPPPPMEEKPARDEAAMEARRQAKEAKRRAKEESKRIREEAEREREAKVEQQMAQAEQAPEGPSASEIRARAEHLKKQRDLILAQRKKARDAAAAAAAPPPMAPPAREAPPPPPQPSSNLKNGAGYSSGPSATDQSRAHLTQMLAGNMKASLAGGSGSLDLQNRIDRQRDKMDFEMTKEQLRFEAINNPLPH